jgi:hypothetical protein
MIEKTAKLITLLLCPFLGYGFSLAIYQTVKVFELPKQFVAFAVGFIAFAVIWRIFKRHLQVVSTFEHEITHLIFGLLFFKAPKGFKVTMRDGGHVKLSGSNFLIYLAPYFFPTVSYLLLPFFFFVPEEYLPVFYGVLGVSLAFHLVSTWSELHLKQTDLQKSGILFSIIFLPVANLIFYGALIVLIFGKSEDFLSFWSIGLKESFNLIPGILSLWQ